VANSLFQKQIPSGPVLCPSVDSEGHNRKINLYFCFLNHLIN